MALAHSTSKLLMALTMFADGQMAGLTDVGSRFGIVLQQA